MARASWLRVPKRHTASGIASSAHSLHLFGRHLSLKLTAAFGLVAASLTGASLYALQGNGTVGTQATLHLSSSNDSSSAKPADNTSSNNASTSTTSNSSMNSSSQGTGTTSTTTNTTTVNGQSSTNVTVNGQTVPVPANGTTQQKVGNSTVTISGSHSGDATDTYVNNTSVQVNSDSGGN
jgi:cytoskeletal protein RodZ